MRPRWKRVLMIAPLAIVGMLLFAFIGGEIVLHLWNWLLPPLFGFRAVTFWQALALLALCRILFGGFGRGGGWTGSGVTMVESCRLVSAVMSRDPSASTPADNWTFSHFAMSSADELMPPAGFVLSLSNAAIGRTRPSIRAWVAARFPACPPGPAIE